MFIIVAFM